MALIRSISGFRGTIGGTPGNNLTPIDIVESTAAYASYINHNAHQKQPTVVIGRDGRPTGPHLSKLVTETLRAAGIHVIDLGLTTTPTLEMAVPRLQAQGGIVFTASHNPEEWNALKLLNHRGEFLSAKEGAEIVQRAQTRDVSFASLDQWGSYREHSSALQEHVKEILEDPMVDVQAIRKQKFHLVVDCINSTGALAIPHLLDQLDCSYHLLNAELNGRFAHPPEPLEKNLRELSTAVKDQEADLGIAVDPDVDRLAFVDENGRYIGEEYTLLIAAEQFLQRGKTGTFVSNLSSSKALEDWVSSRGASYEASAVGEVNVVEKMKSTGAILGGEGNGGVIYPALHYGRDALIGISLGLSLMAESGQALSALRNQFPTYEMIKDKIELHPDLNVATSLQRLEQAFNGERMLTIDGLKVYRGEGWVHLRPSNTEPILRVYAEHNSRTEAEKLAEEMKVAFQEASQQS